MARRGIGAAVPAFVPGAALLDGVEGVGAAAPLFPFEPVAPAPLDLLRRPGVVDPGVAVAALAEPVMFGAVGPVVVAGLLAAGPRVVLIGLLGRVVGRRQAVRGRCRRSTIGPGCLANVMACLAASAALPETA